MAEKVVTVNRPNWLASEVGLVPITFTFAQSNSNVVVENGRSIIKDGTIYPANDGTAKGIVNGDVDVTDGDRVGSLVIAGRYLKGKLSAEVSSEAKAVFVAQGLFEQEVPTVVVPDDGLLG